MRDATWWLYITTNPHNAAHIVFSAKSDAASIAAVNNFLSRFEIVAFPVIFNSTNTIRDPHATEHIKYGTHNIPQPILNALALPGGFTDFDVAVSTMGPQMGLSTYPIIRDIRPTETQVLSRQDAHTIDMVTVVLRVPTYRSQ